MDFITSLDFAIIFKIIMIDVMLGADNAIVIALACASLHESVKNKAMLWGTAGAVGLRAVFLACATFLLAVPYLKIFAGGYLVYIGYKLLVENGGEHDVTQKTTIWGAMSTIIVADFMLSLDNVVAVAGAATGAGAHGAVYAIAGIVLSIPIIVYGAKYLMTYMEKYPIIVWVGAAMLGWVGAEMVVSDPLFGSVPELMHYVAKMVGAALVVGTAFVKLKFNKQEGNVNA